MAGVSDTMTTTRRNCLAGLAGGGFLMGGGARAATAPVEQEDDKLKLVALFAKRQSVRRYKPDPVPEEHLRIILDAARRAPTSGNQQPWKFLVIRDRARIERLRERCVDRFLPRHEGEAEADYKSRREKAEKGFAGYFTAPVYVVVLTDSQSTYPSYNHHDGPMAAGYLMLAARALGYGSVYITDSIPEAVTQEVLGIPERYKRVCITPIGVPDGWPEPKAKKKLEEMVAYETI
jgi:nitroreductase